MSLGLRSRLALRACRPPTIPSSHRTPAQHIGAPRTGASVTVLPCAGASSPPATLPRPVPCVAGTGLSYSES